MGFSFFVGCCRLIRPYAFRRLPLPSGTATTKKRQGREAGEAFTLFFSTGCGTRRRFRASGEKRGEGRQWTKKRQTRRTNVRLMRPHLGRLRSSPAACCRIGAHHLFKMIAHGPFTEGLALSFRDQTRDARILCATVFGVGCQEKMIMKARILRLGRLLSAGHASKPS